jgi:hypothetical protein
VQIERLAPNLALDAKIKLSILTAKELIIENNDGFIIISSPKVV